MSRSLVLLVATLTAAGCAGRHALDVTPDRTRADRHQSGQEVTRPTASDSLHTFMAKVRKLSADARPEPREPLATIEATDAKLAAALTQERVAASAETYRAIAEEYRRLNIFDKAHYFYSKALALAPDDAAAFDGLARMWRDSGFPHLGLADAHRAVYFAPHSPVVHNTLGTVLQAMGRRDLARAEYERAVHLDASAAYALNNLCYGWVIDGQAAKAVSACERALGISPQFAAAQNNLALAHAVAGDESATKRAFAVNGDAAAAFYNTGVVYLARHQYGDAVKAFEAAHAARPTMTTAVARARQAAAAAIAEE